MLSLNDFPVKLKKENLNNEKIKTSIKNKNTIIVDISDNIVKLTDNKNECSCTCNGTNNLCKHMYAALKATHNNPSLSLDIYDLLNKLQKDDIIEIVGDILQMKSKTLDVIVSHITQKVNKIVTNKTTINASSNNKSDNESNIESDSDQNDQYNEDEITGDAEEYMEKYEEEFDDFIKEFQGIKKSDYNYAIQLLVKCAEFKVDQYIDMIRDDPYCDLTGDVCQCIEKLDRELTFILLEQNIKENKKIKSTIQKFRIKLDNNEIMESSYALLSNKQHKMLEMNQLQWLRNNKTPNKIKQNIKH